MGIIFIILVSITAVFAFLGKAEATSLVISNVDLTKISDGTYVGAYDNYRFSNKVEVTVINHEITNILPVKIQDGRQALVDKLTEAILREQHNDIDAVSGATASRNGFLKAVEEALKNGVNE